METRDTRGNDQQFKDRMRKGDEENGFTVGPEYNYPQNPYPAPQVRLETAGVPNYQQYLFPTLPSGLREFNEQHNPYPAPQVGLETGIPNYQQFPFPALPPGLREFNQQQSPYPAPQIRLGEPNYQQSPYREDREKPRNDEESEHKLSKEESLHQLKQKYVSGKTKSKKKFNPHQVLNQLLAQADQEERMLSELKNDVQKYASTHLNQIGRGDNYTVAKANIGSSRAIAKEKKDTNSDRAQAVNNLLEMLKTSSAKDVYEYVSTPTFKELCGIKKGIKGTQYNFFRKHLSKPIQNFISEYQNHLSITNDENLCEVLVNQEIREKITAEQLGRLFWYYNPKLVADIIVNFYGFETFVCSDIPFDNCIIDYSLLKLILADDHSTIENVNSIRSKLKVPLLLSTDMRAPGVSPLVDEGLNKFQLFQYDDSTVTAVEQVLRENYLHLLVNNILGLQITPTRSDQVPYWFYQISASLYMLIDPHNVGDPNYYRYEKFKKDLSGLLASYDPNDSPFKKPIIFFGIVNIDGNHYVPYFIHKNKEGNIQVITVDPSPSTYPDTEYEGDHIKDHKLKTRQRMQTIFQDVFPGCEYLDPGVSQMLRQRDCGPNSATVNLDALSSCESASPLLAIIDDRLHLDTDRLTVNHKPSAINYYSGTYVYPPELAEDSLKSREHWQERLVKISAILSMTVRVTAEGEDHERALSILDKFQIDDQIPQEYDYMKLVGSQEQHDLRQTNISAIQSLLLSNPDEGRVVIAELIEEYKSTLVLPEPDRLVEFVKAKMNAEALQLITSAHNNNLEQLASDVIGVLLAEYIPAALNSVFSEKILSALPNRTDLDPEIIVQAYLDENARVYKKLSMHQQRVVHNQLSERAAVAVRVKLIEVFTSLVEDLFARNCRRYLTQLPADLHSINVEDALLYHFTEKFDDKDRRYDTEVINQAIDYLKMHASEQLRRIVSKHILSVCSLEPVQIAANVVQALNIQQQNLKMILEFADRTTGNFIPWSEKQFMQHLHEFRQGIALTKKEVQSYYGRVVLHRVNEAIFLAINQRIGESVRESMKAFLESAEFQSKFARLGIMDLSSYLDAHGKLLPGSFDQSQLMGFINEFGHEKILTLEEYSHQLIQNMVNFYLLEGINEIIVHTLHHHFELIAANILERNSASLNYASLAERHESLLTYNMELNSLLLTHSSYDPLLSSTDEMSLLFRTNFLQPLLVDIPSPDISFSDCGARFNEWFRANKIEPIVNNFFEIRRLMTNILYTRFVIQTLSDIFKDRKKEEKARYLLDHYIETLNGLDSGLFILSLTRDFVTEFKKLENTFLNGLRETLQNCLKNYKKGDITPGSFTATMRPMLCQLLDMPTYSILTARLAASVDEAITHKIDSLEQTQNHKVKAQPTLLTLPNITELPVTYGKPVTKELLIQCIAYWFAHRSLAYEMMHPGLWFNDEHLPELINKLIKVVNNLQDIEDGSENEIAAAAVEAMSRSLLYKEKELGFELFSSTDLLDLIKAALKRTKTLSDTSSTELRYSAIARLLGMPQAKKKNGKRNPSQIQVPEEKIQQKTREIVNKIRAAVPLDLELIKSQAIERLQEGSTTITSKLLDSTMADIIYDIRSKIPVNLMEARNQALAELNGVNGVNGVAESIPQSDVPNVRPEQLRRTGLAGMSIFGGNLSQIEQDLLRIQKRHGNEQDFLLDKADIHILTERLKLQWNKLIMQSSRNRSIAAKHYVQAPNREDRVYIAFADLLAKHYRANGEQVYSYQLLMPDYLRFLTSDAIKQHTFPRAAFEFHVNLTIREDIEKANELAKEFEQTCVSEILLEDLVCLRTGYLLDINWVLRHYEKEQKLKNPYTGETFTNEELDDICFNAKSSRLLDLVLGNNLSCVTSRAIDLLVEYLNGAIFDRGFKSDYNADENHAAGRAYQSFQLKLNQLPASERSALLNETIPGSSDTVMANFNMARSYCLTLRGVDLAKLVIAYKGLNKHGLKNATLVASATNNLIHAREFNRTIGKIDNPSEQYLCQLAQNRQVASNRRMKGL